MKHVTAIFGIAFACAAQLTPSSGGGMPAVGDAISIANALRNDSRLARPVTVTGRDLTLKELLDRFTKQTGIPINIDDSDPSSAYQVFVQCKSVPAWKMMDSLYGAFSITGGEWAWARSGQGGDYSYSFHETPWAKDRSAGYTRIVSGVLTSFIQLMRDLSPLKPEERLKYKEALRKSLLLDDATLLAPFFEGQYRDWFWCQASFFFKALSRDQQDAVLAGATVSVDLASLPPEVYAQYHQSYVFANATFTDTSGRVTVVPEPAVVQFYRDEPRVSVGELAPMIMLKSDTAKGGGSWMATGYLQAGVASAIKRAWMLPGDAPSDASEAVTVVESEDSDGMRTESKDVESRIDRLNGKYGGPPEAIDRVVANMRTNLSLESRLEQLAQGAAVPVVAILPPKYPYGFTNPVGKPVKEFLGRLESNIKHHMYKWRDGVLIVNYPRWFAERVDAIPYSTLTKLQPDQEGLAPVQRWATLINSISEDQTNWLASQCDYAGDPKILRSILLLTNKYPSMLNVLGTYLDTDETKLLYADAVLHDLKLLSETHVRMRIRTVPPNSLVGTKLLYLEWFSDASTAWATAAVIQLPRFTITTSRKLVTP